MWVYTYLYISVRDTNKRRRGNGEEIFFPIGENVFPDRAKIFAKQRKINWKRGGKMMNVCQNKDICFLTHIHRKYGEKKLISFFICR